MTQASLPLLCPNCRRMLRHDGRCACGVVYSVSEDVFDFLGNSDYYWGEMPRTEMEQFLSEAQRTGWRHAARVLVYPKRPDLQQYFEDPRRTAWVAEIPLPAHPVVADLGAGWGTIGFQLAASGAQVWLVEAVRERVELLRLRRAQDNLTDAKIVRASFMDAPLASGAFDLVVLNGVLEWAGIADKSITPVEAQLRLLRNAAAALRVGGFVYVGIENRYGWPQLRGEIDHSGLPFTSLLPRRIATLVLRFSRNALSSHTGGDSPRQTTYRTYTYTLAGYSRLFRHAGLRIRRALMLAPTYNLPNLIAPLDHTPTIARAMRAGLIVRGSRLARALASMPSSLLAAVARTLAPSFGFVLERME